MELTQGVYEILIIFLQQLLLIGIAFDITDSYYFLGFIDFIELKVECPMFINWRMRDPIPRIILEKTAAG